MNNFIFWSPTKFVFGRDTEALTGDLVKQFGGKKDTPNLPKDKKKKFYSDKGKKPTKKFDKRGKA